MPNVPLALDVLPLGHVLLRAAERWPEREALVVGDERLTYRELADRAWQTSRSLTGLGLGPGDHVGILMTNHPDLVATMFGAAMLGGVVVPMNARYRTNELAFIVADADLATIVTTDAADNHVDFPGLLTKALPGLADARPGASLDLDGFPHLRAVVMMGERTPPGLIDRAAFDVLAERGNTAELTERCAGVPLRSTGLIIYTSGTTSAPRGAMLSHEAFVRIWMSTARCLEVAEGDRFWSPLPLFHVAALGPLTFTLARGGTYITDGYFDAGRALEQIEREHATQLYPAYPPIMQALLTHPRFAATDVSSVRTYLNVAPPEVLARFQAALPHAIQVSTFGMTEAGPATIGRRDEALEVRLRTCGRPQPGVEIRVVGEDETVLGPDQPGELQIRGFNTFHGYYNDPQKTREALDDDGWFRTGDRGTVDAEGRVLFLGRVKEMLKVGGENVGPAEIEEHLGSHSAVKLVQVVGIPDERLVEVPVAFVELVPGGEATEEELIEYCRGRIASFKVPRMVRFVAEWPMSATKIQRFKLRDDLLAELERGSSAGTRQPLS